MKTQLQLNTAWYFTLDSQTFEQHHGVERTFPIGKWLEADVPGTIHTDLLRHGLINDPFFRDNERNVQWVDKVDWVYRTEFTVAETFFAMPAIQLVAKGLDTVAEIFVNDNLIARTENMHIEHRFEIRNYLKTGKNDLQIRFKSPTLHAKRLEQKYRKRCHTHDSHRLQLRKAQYSFGWDWGPILPTSGIWKPIYLEAADLIRIKDVSVQSQLDDSFKKARLRIQLTTEWLTKKAPHRTAVIDIAGVKKEIRLEDEQQSVELTLENPKLWWPSGFGEQKLYDLNVEIFADGKLQDTVTKRLGIRKLQLIQEKDDQGESFSFKVNNTTIFCKGANWIPADCFLPQVSAPKYRSLLQMAKDANMNMIRIWGGGIYEQDVFYDLCDELGLLVWQDFMFACGTYPEYEGFKENVAQEIETVVKRLRHHPSLAVWCGNNENEWIWHQRTGTSYTDMPGFNLFHELIPEICQRLDAERPYWPSSPFGGADPNSQGSGNRHQWDIWSRWIDFSEVEKDRGRFITEFGFQAPANISTLKKVMLAKDRHPQSEIMEFHNKQIEGQERLFRFLAGHVKLPSSFDDFVYKSQVVQGEALKACIEHWRRNKFQTAGTLIWQLNDCWPVTSWSLIDSDLQPKAAYYYVRRAFQPVLVSMVRNENKIETWVTNDTLQPISITLKMNYLNFNNESLFATENNLEVNPNCSMCVTQLDFHSLPVDGAASYLHAELLLHGKVVSENRYFMKRFKHISLPKPEFNSRLQKKTTHCYMLRLKTSAFAKSIQIKSDFKLRLQDNYFDLDAHHEKEVEITVLEDRGLTVDDISFCSLV